LEVLIYLALFGLLLYLVYLFIIWVVPYIFFISIGLLGIGCLIGLPVGVYHGIKNYYMSIKRNITNKTFKAVMYVITSLSIILIFAYLVAIFYFLYNYTEKGGFSS